MLFIIGLGLVDVSDISVKGLQLIKSCDTVYLESYTSILNVGIESLESFYGKKIIIADRDLVENGAEIILEKALEENVAFLVVGDPFGATTHSDLVLRAREKNIKVQIVHNASILSAVGCCGLQLYSYGEVVSIPLWTQTWKPDSFFDKISANQKRNLHTLCLLDIKVKEPDMTKLSSKKITYLPPKFMSVAEASTQLLEIVKNKAHDSNGLSPESLIVGLARVGSESQEIIADSILKMSQTDLGKPLHCLVIPAKKLHPLEADYLLQYAANKEYFQESVKS